MRLLYRKKSPVVLVFAGHDPCGGAGLQADIESLAALGAHAATMMTAQTVQNSQGVTAVVMNEPALLEKQCRALVTDMSIAAVKIGLLGTAAMAKKVGALLGEFQFPNVVLDPVLVSGSGFAMTDEGLLEAIKLAVLPQVTIATPNVAEARALAGENTKNLAASWLQSGCEAVLVTGGDEDTEQVHNVLTTAKGEAAWHWPRLPGDFHGTGCTLASAVAAYLAHGCSIESAVERAQTYVAKTLNCAHQPGQGMSFPNRIEGENET